MLDILTRSIALAARIEIAPEIDAVQAPRTSPIRGWARRLGGAVRALADALDRSQRRRPTSLAALLGRGSPVAMTSADLPAEPLGQGAMPSRDRPSENHDRTLRQAA